jgi:hypothetical protein
MDKCPNCEEELEEEQGKYVCFNCFYEDDYEDIPATYRKKERELADKLSKTLLPKQNIKIRFIKRLEVGTYGETRFRVNSLSSVKKPWKDIGKDILFPKKIFRKSGLNPNPKEIFPKTITHELAHASDKVRSHPDFNPLSTEFK